MIQTIKDLVSTKADTAVALAKEIWGYAELSYEETKSAAALIAALKQEGFTIEEGIADIPTAFTATYQCGSGKPVVGFLAEYDALSGLSQKAGCPVQEPVREGGAGHGCGHNLLGAGCYAAAVALKDYLIKEKKDGTVIFFGCPAEEGAGSKQFIARAGYFDNVDFAYTWHPETVNEVGSRGSVAIMGANFTFDGVAAHAGGEPHLGRSALDAVELMNIGVQFLREHMSDKARIHYAITDAGGRSPNVVQPRSTVLYMVRSNHVSEAVELQKRVDKIAQGAALMDELMQGVLSVVAHWLGPDTAIQMAASYAGTPAGVTDGSAAIAVIGGADGPTAIFVTSRYNAQALWGLAVKVFSNVLVIVLNYVFSKLIIFKKK